ncbi:hypothetical protein, partial [Pseudomonas sp. HMWF006]|uniref:hypothetical protein n=1 Tax=Pseudomonas sp. HMWF006 TaxID=2056843 RepID=UPI001C43DD0C
SSGTDPLRVVDVLSFQPKPPRPRALGLGIPDTKVFLHTLGRSLPVTTDCFRPETDEREWFLKM